MQPLSRSTAAERFPALAATSIVRHKFNLTIIKKSTRQAEGNIGSDFDEVHAESPESTEVIHDRRTFFLWPPY